MDIRRLHLQMNSALDRLAFARLAFATLALLLASSVSIAQSLPPALGVDITSANQLSPDQLERIKAYTKFYTDLLKNPASTPEDIENARAFLHRPLSNPGVSATFRFEYSRFIVPELDKVVDGSNMHASVNSFVIASLLESERASTFLLSHVHIQDQSNWQLRLRAAAGAAHLLRGSWMDARRMKTAANTLRDAGLREENPYILRHHLAAIDALDHGPLNEAERIDVRNTLVETLNSLIDRFAQKPEADPLPMLEAVQSGVLLLRQKMLSIEVRADERKAISSKFGPRLGRLLAVANSQWPQAQPDAARKKSYAEMIGTWEGMLVQIEQFARNAKAPEAMRRAWETGDKSQFESQLTTWQATLKQPPYSS